MTKWAIYDSGKWVTHVRTMTWAWSDDPMRALLLPTRLMAARLADRAPLPTAVIVPIHVSEAA